MKKKKRISQTSINLKCLKKCNKLKGKSILEAKNFIQNRGGGGGGGASNFNFAISQK